jgi:translation initiation factor IF-1
MIRIENEFQIDQYRDAIPWPNTVINIDLDFFAPELDHIRENKKIHLIKNMLTQGDVVTIATSPYFIEQWRAIEKLHTFIR